MKRLGLLGLTLMAVFALGAVAAATASAVEPGVLTLAEVAKLEIKQPKAEARANVMTFVGATTIQCKKLWVLPAAFNVGDKKHWPLIKDLDLHFSECTSTGGVKCKTASDANGTELILFDVHLVAFLIGTTLIPGLVDSLLNEQLGEPITITCGLIKIEVTGAITARAVPAAGEEPTTFTVAAEPSLKCDTSDKLCEDLLGPHPLLANGKAATLTTEAQNMTFSTDVTWDF